ncbi:MAG TPA: pyridoxamine 5'-phosphate oxidase family protein [Spirochaetota bacterium]|mgnify:CR=1 FL=1|nr:pyridoxamine 5'-phosphate oxidase family protein [Spirochaetota bacterium]
MENTDSLKEFLGEIFSVQNFAVLATLCGNELYTNIVAFTASDDLKYIVFVTPRNTKKFTNITMNPTVSLFVDNRSNSDSDVFDAVGISVKGKGEPVSEGMISSIAGKYRAEHPSLREFSDSANSSFIRITVEEYCVVRRFQEVSILSADNL